MSCRYSPWSPDKANLNGTGCVEMNVALRKCDADSRIADSRSMVRCKWWVTGSGCPASDENAELKIERVVPEAEEKGRGFRLAQDHQVFPRDFEKKFFRSLGV